MGKCYVIGAGITGLCTAYYLNRSGADVVVLDKGSRDTRNCSYGNAGFIVPSHAVPLASPGIMSQGLKWLMSSKSPFYLQPSVNRATYSWLRKFMAHCTEKHVEQSKELLMNMQVQSRDLYMDIEKTAGVSLGLNNRGIVMLYQSRAAQKEEREAAEMLQDLGLQTKELNQIEVNQTLGVDADVLGGIHLLSDWDFNPDHLMGALLDILESKGVQFEWNSDVVEVHKKNQSLESIVLQNSTGNKKLPLNQADSLILCTGSWGIPLIKSMGLKIPLLAGKGYSFHGSFDEHALKTPVLLAEAKVAINPMGERVRYAGTLELGMPNERVNLNRVAGIREAVCRYFPNSKQGGFETDVWFGLRPCSPDGIPYIGELTGMNNAYICTGHAMLGMSAGTYSGKAIADLILEGKSIDSRLNPGRFQ